MIIPAVNVEPPDLELAQYRARKQAVARRINRLLTRAVLLVSEDLFPGRFPLEIFT